jgi:hypothetical protein
MSAFFRASMLLGAAVFATNALCQEVPISSKEIQDQWPGRTLIGATASGGAVTMVLKTDGTAELSGAANDTGTWRLSENGYCTTWKKIRAGQERCFTARRSGAKITVFNPDGSVSGSFSEIK